MREIARKDSALDFSQIPIGEYAFPGPLRDALVDAILSGEKTTTTTLLEEYVRAGEPVPEPMGHALEAVVDSHGQIVCVTRGTHCSVERLADVTDEHAQNEGEGYADAQEWRESHEKFWTSPEFLEAMGDPPFELTDDTQVVCCEFEVVEKYTDAAD